MKKQLLLAALILGAASANAQIEKITVDGSAASLGTEASAITAGTVLGSSDNVTVKAAYDAYVAYVDTPGTADVIVTTLVAKYNRVNELEKEAIDEEAKALKKKLDAVDSRSDADLPAYIALKAEALALVAKGTALADEIGAVNEDGYLGEVTLNTVDFCDEYDEIEAATSVKLYGEGDRGGRRRNFSCDNPF